MMLKVITDNKQLKPFFKDDVEENNVCVTLDDRFYLKSGKLNTKSLANIAVDDFYNGLNLAKTPPSIDNLLVINRGDSKFSFYLIELKKRKRTKNFPQEKIQSKFKTTIDNNIDYLMSTFTLDDLTRNFRVRAAPSRRSCRSRGPA